MRKTVVLTGATSGIGLACAGQLAARGAFVIGVGRDRQRIQAALQTVRTQHKNADIAFLQCDPSSLGSVRALAKQIQALLPDGRLDALIHNAGTFTRWYQATEDGLETQFAVNYLSGFLLAQLLLPNLMKSPDARIITTSSESHARTRLDTRRADSLQQRRHYNPLWAYKCSKLENVLFTAQFNRLYAAHAPVRAWAVDPGLVNTDIGEKHTRGLVAWFWRQRRKLGTPAQLPAQTLAWLALDDPGACRQALYIKNQAAQRPAPYALREDVALWLWNHSLTLCGLTDLKQEALT